jgi:hypothetical protein
MGNLFSMLFAKVAAVIQWISDLWVAIFVAAWDLVKDAFAWLFEQVLKVAVSAIGAIDTSAIDGYAGQVGALPAELLNILGLLGVGSAINIITAAIVIRMVLQLIPFVRLGS